jgi:hypothetical protein
VIPVMGKVRGLGETEEGGDAITAMEEGSRHPFAPIVEE